MFILVHTSLIILILQIYAISRHRRWWKTIAPLYKCANVRWKNVRGYICRRVIFELATLQKDTMETQTLATALSTLSLNIIDSDSVPTTGIVESTRRGSSSRVTRTYSNCSYTLVNTFRHTAECRATTLPAVRVKRPAGVCPDSTTTMPRAPLLPNSFRRLASGTPRNSPRPLGVRVQAACSRDNNVGCFSFYVMSLPSFCVVRCTKYGTVNQSKR